MNRQAKQNRLEKNCMFKCIWGFLLFVEVKKTEEKEESKRTTTTKRQIGNNMEKKLKRNERRIKKGKDDKTILKLTIDKEFLCQ